MKKIILLISLYTTIANALDIQSAYMKSYNYERIFDYDDAIKVLIPVYEKNKNGYRVNLRLAWLFFLKKRYKNAINHYQKALFVAPKSIEAYLGLLRSYLRIRDFQKAVTIGSVILKIDYYNFYGNYYLMLALKSKKNYTEALSIANKMLTLYPTSILYLEQLADITKRKNPKKAIALYKNILILDPNNVTAKQYISKHRETLTLLQKHY